MGCLFRKRGEFIKAANSFTMAANSYAEAYGTSDKRVSESTKRARMMAGKIAERSGRGGGAVTASGSGEAVTTARS